MRLPGPRRLRTRFLLLTPLVVLLYWHLSSTRPITSYLPARLRNFEAPFRPPPQVRPPVVHEVKDDPEFQYHSPFRVSPDVQFEEELDQALRELEEKFWREKGEQDEEGRKQGAEWPKKIWQVWLSKGWRPGDPDPENGFTKALRGDEEKVNTDTKIDAIIDNMKRWKNLNPDYNYTLLTDSTAEAFVSTYFASIPTLVNVYRTLPVPVMKADLLRYLLLFVHGGVWVDHDIRPVHPLGRCPRPYPASPSTSLIVGIEIDEPYVTLATRNHWHWSRIYGFIQYHIVAKPFSPFLRTAVVRVVAHAYAHGKSKSSGLTGLLWGQWWTERGVWTGSYAEEEILEITGPGVWTDAILDTITAVVQSSGDVESRKLLATAGGPGEEGRVTWAPFTNLSQPKELMVTPETGADPLAKPLGIYVLPINYWGNGQRHSGAGNFFVEEACVNHLFMRSWKRGWWEYVFG
ncbi:nucleotide-diphospho-sugar transferase [Kalaharituber pfeilii]|nr:nucleotide-diphospho-sugar transferase [Kalaharituber pfeilii]